MSFDVYTFCWNEEHLLPLFLNHYRHARRILVLVDETTTDRSREIVLAAGREVRPYHIMDLDGHRDGKAIRNNVWKESKGKVDWVIMQDPDEFLHFPQYPDNLIRALAISKDIGYRAIKLAAYNIFATDEEWDKVDPSKPAFEQFSRGKRIRNVYSSTSYDKINVFNPNYFDETNFHPGSHFWDPVPAASRIRPALPYLTQMLHLKHLGPVRDLKRRKMYRDVLPPELVSMGIGAAYLKSDEELAADVRDAYAAHDIIDLTPVIKPNSNTTPKPSVLCSVMTKNRLDGLIECLQSVAHQTTKPDHVAIYDSSDTGENIRDREEGRNALQLLSNMGIPWSFVFMPANGAHHAHHIANTSGFDLVWRLEDDCIAQPDVLENLLKHMGKDVGAVSGAVFNPSIPSTTMGNVRIEKLQHFLYDNPADPDIVQRMKQDAQMVTDSNLYDVDYLNVSFLYKANVTNYKVSDVSPLGLYGDIIFTHRLARQQYRLLVDTSIKTFLKQYDTGGRKDGSVEWKAEAAAWDHRELVKIYNNEWQNKLR